MFYLSSITFPVYIVLGLSDYPLSMPLAMSIKPWKRDPWLWQSSLKPGRVDSMHDWWRSFQVQFFFFQEKRQRVNKRSMPRCNYIHVYPHSIHAHFPMRWPSQLADKHNQCQDNKADVLYMICFFWQECATVTQQPITYTRPWAKIFVTQTTISMTGRELEVSDWPFCNGEAWRLLLSKELIATYI